MKDNLSLKTPGVDSMCYELARSAFGRAAGQLRPKKKIATVTLTSRNWISWQWQSTGSTENIAWSSRIPKPFPNHITWGLHHQGDDWDWAASQQYEYRGGPHLEQVIEASHSLPEKVEKAFWWWYTSPSQGHKVDLSHSFPETAEEAAP